MNKRFFLITLLLVFFGVFLNAHAETAGEKLSKRKPDLADVAEGVYFGNVISDSKGSSQDAVTLTISRVSKDLVTISSDYPRLPEIQVPLTKAMNTIVQSSGNSAFALDLSKSPRQLNVSFNNEVSWSGSKQ
jgi:hypothetical protein